MNKVIIPVIVGIIAAIIAVSYFVMLSKNSINEGFEEQTGEFANAVSSGPVTILAYEHRLGENVFVHIRGLGFNEKGNFRFFTPQGVLFKTVAYDGSISSDFNQYFKPTPSEILDICTPEELIGEWTVTFDNNVYPPLKFKVTDEYLRGAEEQIYPVC